MDKLELLATDDKDKRGCTHRLVSSPQSRWISVESRAVRGASLSSGDTLGEEDTRVCRRDIIFVVALWFVPIAIAVDDLDRGAASSELWICN